MPVENVNRSRRKQTCPPRRHIDDRQIFLKILQLRDHVAGRIERDAVAVEDQLVIAADLVDVDQRLAEAPHLCGEQFEAELVLADHERRRAEVEQNLAPRRR